MSGKYDIKCDQGSTFERIFTVRNNGVLMDFTGYSARMQVRESVDSSVTIIDISESTDISTKGRITLGGPLGTIAIEVPDAAMQLVPAQKNYWSIEIRSSSGKTTNLLQGSFKVVREVVR